MRKKVLIFVLVCVMASLLSISAFAASNQIYIENTSAVSIKMTSSLYAYTSDGSYIRLGNAIVRSDYRPGYNSTYTAVDLITTLYRDYDADAQHVNVRNGVTVSSARTDDVAIGDYISTGDVTMSASVGAQNVGGSYSMITADNLTVYATLGIILESDGSLTQDSNATATDAY